MKKTKAQWKQLTRQILALGLAVVLVSGMTDFSVLAKDAEKPTVTSEGTVAEKVAEKPTVENTEVETVSGDTVAVSEAKVQAAEPADVEAGIAVYAGDDTADSALVEVTIGRDTSNYSTFDEAMEAITSAAKSGTLSFQVKLLGNAEEVTSHIFDSVGGGYDSSVDITLDLNGYNLGSKKKNDVMGTQVSLYFYSGWNVILKDNGSSSDNKSYMVVYARERVSVYSGRYRGIWINNSGGTGSFYGGSVDSLYIDGKGTIKGGEYDKVSVNGEATLNISGNATTVDELLINSSSANVTLMGGTYGTIWYNTNSTDSGNLSNILKGSYVLISTDEKTKDEIVDNKGKKQIKNVRVAQVTGDRTAPTWEASAGSSDQYGIQINDIWYNTLLSTANFEDHIYNNTALICTFRANDTDVKKICYYIQDVEVSKLADFTPLTSTQLDGLRDAGKFFSDTTDGSGSVEETLRIASTNNYAFVLYAYAVDEIGNRSEYICTNGILLDNIAPTIDINSKNITKGATEVTIPLNMSENVTLVYFCYDEYTAKNAGYNGINALDTAVQNYIFAGYENYSDNLDKFDPFVKVQDGKWIPAVSDGGMVTITTNKVEVPLHIAEVKAGEEQITISGLTPDTATRILIQAIDKAGNLLPQNNTYMKYCQFIDFRTTKLTPQIVTEPSVTGVYGARPSELTVTDGKVSYNGTEIAGTWKITEDSSTRFEVGTDQTCAVTFTPENAQYGAVVAQVVPTIAKRPITITANDLHIVYGNDLPKITEEMIRIEDYYNSLVYSDDTSTIANTLHYVTEVKKGADVGHYQYTLESDSKNYEVTVEYVSGLSYGTLSIEQAQGVIEKTNKFRENVEVAFGDSAFSISDWVKVNHTETPISYEVVDAKNRRGREDEIITVTSEGMVQIHNAGTATIRISLPASKNYERSDYLEVKVTVNPKSIIWGPIVKNYLYTRGGYDELTVESLLPEGFGSIEDVEGDNIEDTGIPNGFLSGSPMTGWVENKYPRDIRYTVKPGKIGDTAEIKWYLKTNNYFINGDDKIVIKLVLVDRKVVKLQGDNLNLRNTLTYGQALSELKFGDNTFVDSDTDEKVPGTLAWRNPNVTPDAGTYEAEWVFTPDDKDTYIEYTGTVAITVNKANPSEVTAPILKSYDYRPMALGENPYLLKDTMYVKQQGVVTGIKGEELAGTWSWMDPNFVPEIGEHTLKVYFTPTDQNYNSVESSITLKVRKSYISVERQPSVAKAYTHGDYLYSQNPQNGAAGYHDWDGNFTELEGTYLWYKEPNVQLSYSENKNQTKTYKVMFIPKDQEHYQEQMTDIFIDVNQAEYPPIVPGDLNVRNSCTTLRDVTLPKGWSFYEADLNTELKVDDPVKVTVFYEDNYNYINTTKEITVTRSSCDHEKTERREVVKATCIAEGNTGYLWCLECNTKLEEGTVTSKDPTNHTALTSKVIKQPTTSEEGIMEYTCSACGYSATKAIAKIVSTSSSSGSSSGSQSNNDDKPAPTPTPTPVATPVPAVTPVRPNRIPVKPTVKEEPKAPAPFLRGENGKEGWAVIAETVTEAEDGDTVIVDMNGSSVVPGDVFDRIRGKDITVEFDLGNGILWKVNGQSVEKGNVGDIDFTVRAGEDANDTIPLEIINNLTGERTYMNLSLAYEGEFGFEAVLSLNVGMANAGLYANLFYYNEATKELEFLCAGEIGQDGGAELTFTHASEYTIVIDEQPMETDQSQEVTSETGVQDNQEDNTVNIAPEVENTGHTALLIFCIILIAAAFIVIGVIVFVKKNKKEE